jgi:hypothetical protein
MEANMMSKGERIAVFLASMALLGIVFALVRGGLPASPQVCVVLFSSLIMLSFGSLFIEHFFTTPGDVLANTVSILLLLAPLRRSLGDMGNWYWLYFGYNLVLAAVALSALLLLDKDKSTSSLQNRVSDILKRFATSFGNGRVLYFALFFLTLVFYVDVQSIGFLVLFAYSFVVLVIDPRRFTLELISSGKRTTLDVGEIIGVQSENTFLARLYRERPAIEPFDFVQFRYPMSEDDRVTCGLVIDKYLLDEEQWIKVLCAPEIHNALVPYARPHTSSGNVVSRLDCATPEGLLDSYVGVVLDKSTISRIRFEYHGRAPVSEGTLLELTLEGSRVMYQVVQGITEAELLQSKNEAGYVVGEAVQLGTWDETRRAFDKYGWVPDINTPVFVASDIESITPTADEVHLGFIPGTNYPVFMSRSEAITHHVAILGVTGCGKSVLARHIVREIAAAGTKVICVDFTREYSGRFPDYDPASIVPNESADAMFSAIDSLSVELSKFRSQQNLASIQVWQGTLRNGFFESIKGFLQSDRHIALFELPDVSNTTGILEYTKWFFQVLFDIARRHDNFGHRLCIVLEEAHTVIPEWTFLGVSEKEATSLVNNIGQIALQGRKYKVGFIVVAQRTANVSKTVLTQCNSIVAFQQFDKTGADFLSNYMGTEMVQALPSLRFRQAIAVGKAFRTGIPVILEVKEIAEPQLARLPGPPEDAPDGGAPQGAPGSVPQS